MNKIFSLCIVLLLLTVSCDNVKKDRNGGETNNSTTNTSKTGSTPVKKTKKESANDHFSMQSTGNEDVIYKWYYNIVYVDKTDFATESYDSLIRAVVSKPREIGIVDSISILNKNKEHFACLAYYCCGLKSVVFYNLNIAYRMQLKKSFDVGNPNKSVNYMYAKEKNIIEKLATSGDNYVLQDTLLYCRQGKVINRYHVYNPPNMLPLVPSIYDIQ